MGKVSEKPTNQIPQALPTSTPPKPDLNSAKAPQSPPSSSLESHVQSSLESAVAPSEEAIQAQKDRERQKENRQGAGQLGKKRGPYKRQGESKLVTDSAKDKSERYRRVGREIADSIIVMGRTLGGEDWNTIVQKDEKTGEVLIDEKRNLQEAWADMAEEYEWEKFPAWLGVTLATGGYILPRLAAPSTKARVSKFKLWWDGWQLKRQEAKEAKVRAKEEKKAETNA